MQTIRRTNIDFSSMSAFAHKVAQGFVRGGVADAEDIAQMALMKMLRRCDEGGTPTRGWLYTVVRTTAYDQGRRTVAERERVTRYESRFSEASVCERADENHYVHETYVPERDTCEPDVLPRITSAVNGLSERMRRALVLQLEGYTYSEIAALTGANIGTVRSTLHNARKRTQALLGDLV